ncbi:hypothetical protein KKB18_04595 [bacterium]|nr:hypothetical protein [bacterium]MBU1935614.1 hypothetical protein [Patescibacteria group bacterium]
MNAFAQTVEGWHDFYHVIGDVAAALMGLLFVSLSLNADVIIKKANTDLRVLATQTFTSFINVLMIAVIFLIPNQDPQGLGIPLLGIDCFGLYSTISRYLLVKHDLPRVWRTGGVARRFIMPTICFIVLLIIAISVSIGKTSGFYWLVPILILFLLDAIFNSWDLLLRLREPSTEE